MSTPHHTVQRLYKAAHQLRDVSGQSAVARLLGVSPQVVKNWEIRGVSTEGALIAQKEIGCDANWVLEDLMQMPNLTWRPEPDTEVARVESSAALYKLNAESTWPFDAIKKEEITKLSEFDRGQVEGFIKGLLQAGQHKRKSNGAPG